MRGYGEIVAENERGLPKTTRRRCSIHVNSSQGGGIVSVILHSASNRDTKFIDWKSTFQREFFRAVLDMYDVDIGTLKDETADPDAIDKVVESYWGYYPQPEQKNIDGYAEAEDAD